MLQPRNVLNIKVKVKGKVSVKTILLGEIVCKASPYTSSSETSSPDLGDLFRCLRQVAFAEATSGNVIAPLTKGARYV